jgi:hypothetical protein
MIGIWHGREQQHLHNQVYSSTRRRRALIVCTGHVFESTRSNSLHTILMTQETCRC